MAKRHQQDRNRPDCAMTYEGEGLEWLSEEGRKLLTPPRHVVPFVGAGISKPCGLPGSDALAQIIRAWPELEETGLDENSALSTVAAAAQLAGVTELHERVAEIFDLERCEISFTRTVELLALATSGVVVTLNYDLLIE